MLELAAGRCDIALSGGLDTFNDIFMYMCFSKTPALSPSGDARPFDAAADGTVLGEGLGILVLKRLDDARRDGDRIYAVIRSMGSSSDGRGQAVYAPSAAGQVKALRQAYDLAGVSPGSIELVEAHGTGTRVGDAIELEALEQVYSEREFGLALVRPGLDQVAGGAHQGGSGRRGPDQGGAGASSQGVAADDQGQPAHRAAGLGQLSLLSEHREQALAAPPRPSPPGRGQRLRLRGQQFPLPARGSRARAGRDRLGGRRPDPGLL